MKLFSLSFIDLKCGHIKKKTSTPDVFNVVKMAWIKSCLRKLPL